MPDSTLGLALDARRAYREGAAGLARRQRDRLAELVAFTRRVSPFYRTHYRGLPERIEDPALLPVVDKPTLMAEFDDWVTDPAVTVAAVQDFVDDPRRIGQPFLDRYTVTTTSGTTGVRGLFLHDHRSLTVTSVLALRMLTSWLTGRDLYRILRGGGRITMVVASGGHFATAVGAARLRNNPLRRRLISVLSVHSPLPELVEKLNALHPAVLAPYASVAALLASEQQAGQLHIRPTLIVLAAEGLPAAEYHRIAAAFQAIVVSSYAATECTFLSFSCPQGWLHVNSDWVLLEPVTADHQPVPAGELSDTVLISNLANRIQPILRYDLGDRVVQRPDPCPCGSPLPAIQVHGRAADLLIFPRRDGATVAIPALAFTTVADRTGGVDLVQIVQTSPTELRIRLRSRPDADPGRAWNELAAALRNLLDDQGLGHVTLHQDHQPPQPTSGGKYRNIIPFPGSPLTRPPAKEEPMPQHAAEAHLRPGKRDRPTRQ